MPYSELRRRLFEGRPLVLDCDVAAALRARGHVVDSPGALGTVLHRSPEVVLTHHERELELHVDIITAVTADTTPRSLSEGGMEHRAARLTGLAMDLAFEAASAAKRPVGVAAVLGSDHVTATKRRRFEDEAKEHVARVAVAGAELLIIRGSGSRLDLVFSVASASACELPSFPVIEADLARHDEIPELVERLEEVGAAAILFEVSTVDDGLRRLEAAARGPSRLPIGAVLSAAPDALRGFPTPLFASWVERTLELVDAGARIVGGGAGTTEEHTEALVGRLGVLHPSLPVEGSPTVDRGLVAPS